ncbi:MAG: class I SAM-dependent DNA methyltransferase [Acidimicrobiia bacterium]|nr:class I SAM-dependent DNA methyltransferase [Acidimicrobiia bacterium]
MLEAETKRQIDQVWNDFWSGGISNPLEVMEQLTYLLFIKRLDDLHTLEERRANRTGRPMERRIFPEGNDQSGMPYENYRWSRFKGLRNEEMYSIVADSVFPFLRKLSNSATYLENMEGARFTIPTASLLGRAVKGLDSIQMDDSDTKGDVYEHMLSSIATAGQNGQFRTPRHIIELMVHMMDPQPDDVVCDPASGTAGFLVGAAEYVRKNNPELFTDEKSRRHYMQTMFHGFDFDRTMLRIGSMNMILHGVDDPTIKYRDSLLEESEQDESKYTVVLANPPFAGSLDADAVAKDLVRGPRKTRKTELLFISLFERILKAPHGRAAVIVPDGVLFGSTKPHKELRRMLVEDHRLDGIVSLPSGVFKPYAGVSTAILLFTKTNSGGTDHVWFYDMQADGFSLDDKRAELLDPDKLGATATLTDDEHDKNNLPDALTRWNTLRTNPAAEQERARTEQSFCVPKDEIADSEYDLSINRYKEIVYEQIEYPAPADIIANLEQLEAEITQGLADLKAMLA